MKLTYIILKSTNRRNCRTPNISIDELKRSCGNMSRNIIRQLVTFAKLTRIANVCMLRIITKKNDCLASKLNELLEVMDDLGADVIALC
jgi:hypothetical protein